MHSRLSSLLTRALPTRPARRLHSEPSAAIQGNMAVLHTCPLFATLSPADLSAVYGDARLRRIAKGNVVFQQDDPAQAVYVLIGGKLKLVRAGAKGRQLILGFLQPPDVFGYVAVLRGTGHAYAARVTEDGQVLTWDVPTMLRIMRTYPEIALNGLQLIAGRIQTDWMRLQDLATASVEQRLARALVRLARASGGAEVTLPRQDLAEYVGTTPPTLSRILSRWKHGEIVSTTRDKILIRHLDRLRLVAEDAEFPALSGCGGSRQRFFGKREQDTGGRRVCF